MATYTTNYNLTKIDLNDAPPDITVINSNWDTIDAELKTLSSKTATEVVKTITVLPEMWVGTEFPYTCTVAHKLGGEPSTRPLIDLDTSSCSTLEDVENAESAYNHLYKATFDATNLVLYSKEIPQVGYTIIIKVVM